ncbi:hypothetical protein [Lishizhenia sp.]|uniref:hypothetical protein n=1 Tax=Lishizhenia sp. TaxID=2497594 RepID=UPI00299CECD2|nr:hypothetical protein [Lishizhenia sp.]MDX1445207.1 hypothetical protein [Lishizhenia sp.]
MKIFNAIHLLTFLVTFFFIQKGFGQEPQYIAVNWKVGDIKTITHIDSTNIYQNNQPVSKVGLKTTYSMEIVDLKDTVYEVHFKQFKNTELNLDFGKLVDSTFDAQFAVFTNYVIEKMASLEYRFLVDKNTALAFEIKDETLLQTQMKTITFDAISTFLNTLGDQLTEQEKKQIQLQSEIYMQDQIDNTTQTMMNAFNYIFQAYTFPYLLNDVYEMQVEVYNIDESLNNGQTYNTPVVIESWKRNNQIFIDYTYIYNKEQMFEEIVSSQGNPYAISIDEFEITEGVLSSFNTSTSWINSSKSFTHVQMGEIEVQNAAYVSIK